MWGHIWACPPAEGDDYIFHGHPPEQKVPKPKRLQDWYKKMLDKVRGVTFYAAFVLICSASKKINFRTK